MDIFGKALFHRKIESSFLHLNPEILTKLFHLIYYLNLTPILTLNTTANIIASA